MNDNNDAVFDHKANVKAVLAAMLNAGVTLQTASDSAQVPGSLARQARRDAIALSEAITLLTLISVETNKGDLCRRALAAATELLERKDEKIEQLTTQLLQVLDEINQRERTAT